MNQSISLDMLQENPINYVNKEIILSGSVLSVLDNTTNKIIKINNTKHNINFVFCKNMNNVDKIHKNSYVCAKGVFNEDNNSYNLLVNELKYVNNVTDYNDYNYDAIYCCH